MEYTLLKLVKAVKATSDGTAQKDSTTSVKEETKSSNDFMVSKSSSIIYLTIYKTHSSMVVLYLHGYLVILTLSHNLQHNGINVLRIPARDVYAYGLHLMDTYFSREELGKSLLFESKKSEKPGLDETKVCKIFGKLFDVNMCQLHDCFLSIYLCTECMEKRYGTEWDIKTFTQKANQKCRDSVVKPCEH